MRIKRFITKQCFFWLPVLGAISVSTWAAKDDQEEGTIGGTGHKPQQSVDDILEVPEVPDIFEQVDLPEPDVPDILESATDDLNMMDAPLPDMPEDAVEGN